MTVSSSFSIVLSGKVTKFVCLVREMLFLFCLNFWHVLPQHCQLVFGGCQCGPSSRSAFRSIYNTIPQFQFHTPVVPLPKFPIFMTSLSVPKVLRSSFTAHSSETAKLRNFETSTADFDRVKALRKSVVFILTVACINENKSIVL